MTGFIDLTRSERSSFALLGLVCATVLGAFGVITGEQWLVFVGGLSTILIASKTVRPSRDPQIPQATAKQTSTPTTETTETA